ncbi:MAG: hypothetical protein AVDCRST_MAG57-2012 [uncultured Blastococcus sp.]|uniref:Uncharacterized protein n=1 Tax=uncultured Blastococcus sp. TaxID=217144 RepID=A0A6J4IF37_9ACTN|nr:MAG: hypothetical protein AVDCRST_MAG57-2012 [uncultured Blastococcus sp.]
MLSAPSRLAMRCLRVSIVGRPGVPAAATGPTLVPIGVPVRMRPTRCARGVNALNPSHPARRPAGRRVSSGLQLPAFPFPVRRDPLVPCCPRARAHEGTR